MTFYKLHFLYSAYLLCLLLVLRFGLNFKVKTVCNMLWIYRHQGAYCHLHNHAPSCTRLGSQSKAGDYDATNSTALICIYYTIVLQKSPLSWENSYHRPSECRYRISLVSFYRHAHLKFIEKICIIKMSSIERAIAIRL